MSHILSTHPGSQKSSFAMYSGVFLVNLESTAATALRPEAGRVNCSFQVLIASVLLSVLSPSLDACSCALPPACVLPTDYPLVFIGRVVQKQVDRVNHADGRPPDLVAPAVVSFEVADYLRGQKGPRVEIRTTEGCCVCGYSFVVGLIIWCSPAKQTAASARAYVLPPSRCAPPPRWSSRTVEIRWGGRFSCANIRFRGPRTTGPKGRIGLSDEASR